MKPIKYCSNNFVTYYKANFEVQFLPLYTKANINEFNKIFSEDVVYINEEIKFNYQDLVLPTKSPDINYIQKNTQILHQSLNTLTPSQASREELWFTMLHTYYLEYLLAYVQLIKDDNNFKVKLKNAIFFTTTNSKSLLTQQLSRYWWTSYLTLDFNNSNDIYYYTKFFTNEDPKRKIAFILTSKILNNSAIINGILEAVYESVESNFIKNSLDTYLLIIKHFNMVGGVRILDILTKEQIKSETIQLLNDIYFNKIKISTKQKLQIFTKF